MKADFACVWAGVDPPGAYSTSTPLMLLPGTFGSRWSYTSLLASSQRLNLESFSLTSRNATVDGSTVEISFYKVSPPNSSSSFSDAGRWPSLEAIGKNVDNSAEGFNKRIQDGLIAIDRDHRARVLSGEVVDPAEPLLKALSFEQSEGTRMLAASGPVVHTKIPILDTPPPMEFRGSPNYSHSSYYANRENETIVSVPKSFTEAWARLN